MKHTHVRIQDTTISDDDLAMLKAALNTRATAHVVNYLTAIGLAAFKATTKHARI